MTMTIPQLTCSQCAASWMPRKVGALRCPRCGRRDWNEPKKQAKEEK